MRFNMQEKRLKTSWHFNISLAKSCFRIIASITLIRGELTFAGILFILAEVLGIVEEF